MRVYITLLYLFSSLLIAEMTGKEVYKSKCASCHKLYIPASILIENFMEHNNTILKLNAPTINQIVFRLKTRIGDPKGDKDIHKMEVDSFVADYIINPDKSKSVCLPKVLRYFKTMPSMKGKISMDEIDAVSTFLYDYNPEEHIKKKLELVVDYEKALERAKKENKIIILKLVRKDCHFCQKMDREVFEDSEVRDVLNKDFIMVKIDIGKDELPLGLKKGMTPTFVFVDKDGDIMAKVPGSWSKKDFLDLLQEAIKTKKRGGKK